MIQGATAGDAATIGVIVAVTMALIEALKLAISKINGRRNGNPAQKHSLCQYDPAAVAITNERLDVLIHTVRDVKKAVADEGGKTRRAFRAELIELRKELDRRA